MALLANLDSIEQECLAGQGLFLVKDAIQSNAIRVHS